MTARVSINPGDRFTRLTVVAYVGNTEHKHRNWECLCDCGETTFAITSSLRNGNKKSCGCLLIETTIIRNTIHGFAPRGSRRIPEYGVWQGLKARCLRETTVGFKNYGGRETDPITVCDEWMHSFEQFYADMGPRPSAEYEIERVNNNGPYSKENCIWDTRLNQMQNLRKSVFLELNGARLTMSAWARKIGMNPVTLYYRKKRGWTDEKALTTPVRANLLQFPQ